MDLRKKKTLRNIRNAFIELRSRKPLEKISVTELADKAEISKATFYLHYRDIYDLSKQLQDEVIQNILQSMDIPRLYEDNLKDITDQLFRAFVSQQTMIDILFAGSQSALLPSSIESGLREYIFDRLPEKKEDTEFSILLTFKVYGGFYAYVQHNSNFGPERILKVLKER